MVFLPILFLSLAFASEELAVETYCFPSDTARARIEKKLSMILVPSDKTEAEKNCLTVSMRPHRRELIQNYTLNLEPETRITFSSAENKRPPCLLQVEKVRALNKQNTGVQVSPFPGAATSETNESSKDVMQIQTIDKFSLMVAQDAIEGSCRYINKDLYEVTITARRDPKPIVPPNLPPGTIVVVTTPPPDQKTLTLSTSLELSRGSRVELGSIVRDLRKKNSDISIKPEAQIENTTGQEEEKVFLMFQ